MKNRFTKLLNSVPVTKGVSTKVYLDEDTLTNPRIDRLNANSAGLFTDLDVVELDKRIEREAKATKQMSKRPSKTFTRITVRNATKEQVQAALHKVHFKNKKA
jgi:hypothetical protein